MDGNPTTDPHQVAALLPTGGYKGSGLSLMFTCLSSLMVGNPLLVPNLLGQKSAPTPGTQNSVVAAIDIGSFTDAKRYREDVDELVDVLKARPKAEGFDEVFVPGEPEDRTHDEYVQHGIPLPAGTRRRLHPVAQRFEIALPPGV
jgi:ureidoglycolate dehydrogenase (NAD+)